MRNLMDADASAVSITSVRLPHRMLQFAEIPGRLATYLWGRYGGAAVRGTQSLLPGREATSHRIDYESNAEILPKSWARLIHVLKCQHEVPTCQMRLGELAVDHIGEQRIGGSCVSIGCAYGVNVS
jgi:hypothetical protein